MKTVRTIRTIADERPRTYTEEDLKGILGEDDFAELQLIRTRKADKAKRARVKEIADAMVSEVDGKPGKYFAQYSGLDKQLQAIYDKATNEATALVDKGDS